MVDIKLFPLASGSKGNSVFLQIGDWKVLVDCGLSRKKTIERLKIINETLTDISGIFVTHEHGDHSKSVVTISRKDDIKVYVNEGTYDKIRKKVNFDTEFFDTGDCINFDEIEVETYEIDHDARDPVAYLFKYKQKKIFGYLVDTGRGNPFLLDGFRGVDVLMIESNHSFDLLTQSSYPDFLKERILSNKGHLSNNQALEIIDEIKPKIAILGHLSEDNNEIGEVYAELEFKEYDFRETFFVIIPTDEMGKIIKWKK